jgi:hypothetical protein
LPGIAALPHFRTHPTGALGRLVRAVVRTTNGFPRLVKCRAELNGEIGDVFHGAPRPADGPP